MTTESDALREALFAQMSAPPLPEYSGEAVILRGCKMPTPSKGTSSQLTIIRSFRAPMFFKYARQKQFISRNSAAAGNR
jgi:hypothetical protein